jgi:hypothetical protein
MWISGSSIEANGDLDPALKANADLDSSDPDREIYDQKQ